MPNIKNSPGLIARTNAITILNQVLSSRHGLEEVIAASKPYNAMEQRDRAFVRLLVASTFRRLGFHEVQRLAPHKPMLRLALDA